MPKHWTDEASGGIAGPLLNGSMMRPKLRPPQQGFITPACVYALPATAKDDDQKNEENQDKTDTSTISGNCSHAIHPFLGPEGHLQYYPTQAGRGATVQVPITLPNLGLNDYRWLRFGEGHQDQTDHENNECDKKGRDFRPQLTGQNRADKGAQGGGD